ncbi:MAG: hypothetical protein JRI59_11260 [Deltaproteobacteria bacterium]|nr:hypothetical protein [Deltaproteobacteria bacterium]
MADLGELIVRLSADIKNLDSSLKQAKGSLQNFDNTAKAIAQSVRRALTFTVAGFGIYQLGQALKNAFQEGIQAVDSFHLTTIGVASTLTDMAEDQTDVQANYTKALAYSRDMYNELELAAQVLCLRERADPGMEHHGPERRGAPEGGN